MFARRAGATRPALSQTFLSSDAVALQLVTEAQLGPSDLVLEIGAGSGTLTRALATRAGRVVAIEIDQRWAARLRERFAGDAKVEVVEGDALALPLPDRPFSVVSNLPFHRSSALLRKLLDNPAPALLRAELIVAWGFAIGRASVYPTRLASLSWQPWFELVVTRRLAARLFRPAPAADAAVLSIRPRQRPLLSRAERSQFLALVRQGYRSGRGLRESLGRAASGPRWERLAAELGFAPSARAVELDVWQWVAVFRFFAGRGFEGSLPARGRERQLRSLGPQARDRLRGHSLQQG